MELFKNLSIDLGWDIPYLKLKKVPSPLNREMNLNFKHFALQSRIYSPSMIEQVKSDEMAPPREVRVGGIFEVPWQGFHADALIGTRRFMEDMRGEVDACDGFFIKFEDKFFRDENKLGELCAKLEGLLERVENYPLVCGERLVFRSFEI